MHIQPIPMYGKTQGHEESDDYIQLPGGIKKGKSFKIDLKNAGLFSTDFPRIKGFKISFGATFTDLDNIFDPKNNIFTKTNEIKKLLRNIPD